MLSGKPTRYLKTTAESGNPRVQAFCPNCGTPIYSTAPGDNPDAYMIRIGTLRQRDQLIPRQQNWFRSARPWVTELASIPRNEKGRRASRARLCRRDQPRMSPIENMRLIGRRVRWDSCRIRQPERPAA